MLDGLVYPVDFACDPVARVFLLELIGVEDFVDVAHTAEAVD